MKTKSVLSLCLILGALVLPAFNSGAQAVTAVAAGQWHSLFLKNDGSLWSMGKDTSGELGNGTNTAYIPYGFNRPEKIMASNVTAIAAAGDWYWKYDHSLFIKSDGSLWAFGNNNYGQLGDGTHNSTNRPEQIVASGVTAIAAKQFVSMFLKNDGSVWAMGKNFYSLDTNRPVRIVASNVTAIATQNGYGYYLKMDGSLWQSDGKTSTQIVNSNVMAIAAGGSHSLFLKSNGSLWTFGYNAYGQLGDGTTSNAIAPEQIVASNVIAIAGGDNHSLFLKSDGSLWAMGYNQLYGQLGDGTYSNTNRPEQIVASNVTAISGGGYHSMFVKSDGSLWATGGNDYGQLGDGTSGFGLKTNHAQVIVAGPMNLVSIGLAGNDLVFNGINGVSGATNYLLMSADAALPRNQWMRVMTNILNASGNFTITNPVDPNAPQSFYLLQSQ